MTLLTVTLTWDFTDALQTGETAFLQATPTNPPWVNASGMTIVDGEPLTQDFTGGPGSLAGIIANDNAGLSPAAQGYQVTVKKAGGAVLYDQTVILSHAAGATQDLSTLTPAGEIGALSPELLAANNLSDVASPSTALANLGGATPASVASAVGVETSRAETAEGVLAGGVAANAAAITMATADQAYVYADDFTGTDDQKMAASIQALFGAGPLGLAGGTIMLSARAWTFALQWATAYTAGVATAVKIQGAGVAWNGAWGPPSAATTCTFTATGVAAMTEFQHIGTIEITGIQLRQANTGTPFLLATNATPNIHDNVFSGGGTGLTCATDAIVLGGTSTSTGPGDTAKYNAYQGRVWGNFFDGIRCGVHCQSAANGISIRENTWSITCGSNSATVGAITIMGANPGLSVGGTTASNLFETAFYPNVIWADFAIGWLFNGDSFYDPTTANTIAYIKFNSNNAKDNTVIVGYGTISGSFPGLVFVSQASRLNTIITGLPTNITAAKGTIIAGNPLIADSGLITNGEHNGVPQITLGDSATEAGNIPTIQTGNGNPNTTGTVTATSGSAFIQRNATAGQAGFFLKAFSGTAQWYIPGTMLPVTTQAASYTVAADDALIIMNGASLTATLPAPSATLAGKIWEITNKNSTPLTVAAPSGTVNGAASVQVTQWQTARVRTDGTSFYASTA